ncbi:hypothetical protein [Sphingomonas sp. G-3-2-10]|uniref:hypothetical protein n=1 Tax=Sphingomonas sp. G-3-2-10 TaxID=2728838 RepID=UPI00146EF61D|nr:hypothetical protein [Sphingomonas sp. G-3-2-10]NML07267.1 hypothetical protein [Sphingomonas sp. G-3-2-10]
MAYARDHLDYDAEDGWSMGRAVFALLVAVLVIGGVAASVPPGDRIAIVIGQAAGTAALVYAVVYLVALRGATAGWKIGAFLFLAVIAGGFQYVRGLDARNAREQAEFLLVRQDAEAMLAGREMPPAPGLKPDTPVGVIRVMLRSLQREQRAYEKSMTDSGIHALLDPAKLGVNSAILRDCTATERQRGRVKQYRTATERLMNDTRAALKAMSGMSDTATAMDVLDGLERGMADNGAENARRWELGDQALVELGAMCRVLARRNWRMEGEMVGFTSDADLSAFQAVTTRYNRIFDEQSALEQAMQARAQASLRKLPR